MKVVLITGAAPYLGGPQTWRPLRDAAPEIDFVEVDPLLVAGDADMERHVRDAVEAALQDADAVVAHGGAARLALDAVAQTRSALPALLLTPMMVLRTTTPLRIAGAMLGWPFVGGLITRFARSKLGRLRADRGYVRRQLGFLVRRDLISDALVDEAQQRLRDPRSAEIVERTPEFMAAALAPLDPETDRVVTNRRSVFGGIEYYERKTARRKGGIILPNANGSPMIEDPVAVAGILRDMLGTARDA